MTNGIMGLSPEAGSYTPAAKPQCLAPGDADARQGNIEALRLLGDPRAFCRRRSQNVAALILAEEERVLWSVGVDARANSARPRHLGQRHGTAAGGQGVT